MTTTNISEEFVIAAFISETKTFLKSFKNFQAQISFSTPQLLEHLEEIADEIYKFVDTPRINRNLNDQIIREFEADYPKSFSCRICGITSKGGTLSDFQTHMQSKLHQVRLVALNSKGLNLNVMEGNQQKNKENVEEKPSITNSMKENQLIRKRKEINKNGATLENKSAVVGKRESRIRRRKTDQNKKLEDKAKVQTTKRIKQFLSKPLGQICENAIAEGKALRNYTKHNDIKENILDLVIPKYPEAKVYFFGSRFNGLGTRDSDIDIFLQLETPINKCYNLSGIGYYIDYLKERMMTQPNIWKNLQPIKDAKVPILKARFDKESIECDISFSNPYGVYNTSLINHLLQMQPICQNICILMKYIYKRAVVKKRMGFTSYSLTLMVIFFMQQEKLLPSIKTLQTGPEDDEMAKVGLWVVTYQPKSLRDLNLIKAPDNIKTTLEYFVKMLKFYTEIDYEQYLISPYLGSLIPKKGFKINIQESMPTLSKHISENKSRCLTSDFMTIQDPFILDCNVTKNCSLFEIAELKEIFMLVSRELSSSE